jgi:hypothetical protein
MTAAPSLPVAAIRGAKDGKAVVAATLTNRSRPGDLVKVVGAIKGEDAFRPENQGQCPLVKQ